MRPEVEQDLAHTLLIELLAYQFASPVRWIETQDVILAERNTERIVEIGPADTLGGMAKRTLASKYEAYDAALSVQRQILCYNKDAKEIYYDVDPVEEETTPAAGSADSSNPAASSGPAQSAPVAAAATPPSAGPAAAVADTAVTAVDIVRALIAQKLKKPLIDIPLSKAIKDLVGGTSLLLFPTNVSYTDISTLQVNQLCKMRYWGTSVKSSVLHRKSQKTPLSMSLVLRCKQHSMDSWASSLLR